MLLGKRPRPRPPPPMKRTTSLSEINSVDPNGRQIPDHSSDFTHTPHFLRSCSLCDLTLIPSRDIYMYRGDTAFCSVECRQQAMNRDDDDDERKKKEKCSFASNKKINAPHHSKVPSNAETVGAL